MHIFTYLFNIFYGSLLSQHSAACQNNAGVNATDSSKINWYVSLGKLLQDGLKYILLMCCIHMQMHLLFNGLQGVDFLGKQTRSTVGNTGERFRFQHKSNSTAMLMAALSVHITWKAFIGSNITELCGSPGEVEQPEVVQLLLLVSFIFPSCRWQWP